MKLSFLLKVARELCLFSIFGSYLRIHWSSVYITWMFEVVKLTENCSVTNDLSVVERCSSVRLSCLCTYMEFCGTCLLKEQVDLSCRRDFSLVCLAFWSLWEYRTIACLCSVSVCQNVTCSDRDSAREMAGVTSELRLR